MDDRIWPFHFEALKKENDFLSCLTQQFGGAARDHRCDPLRTGWSDETIAACGKYQQAIGAYNAAMRKYTSEEVASLYATFQEAMEVIARCGEIPSDAKEAEKDTTNRPAQAQGNPQGSDHPA